MNPYRSKHGSRPLLATFLFISAVCFPRFFFCEIVPGLIGFSSIYLVTTAEFVADQLLWDKQQQTTSPTELPSPADIRRSSNLVFKIANCNNGTAAHRDKCDTLWASADAQTYTLPLAEPHCSIAARQWVEQRRITGGLSLRFCF